MKRSLLLEGYSYSFNFFFERTGSGKTTILNALLRLYNINQGMITLFGENIYQYELSELRQRISIVPQMGFLFKGTLKQNLDPDNQYTQNQLEEIFKLLNNKIQKIIDNHKDIKDIELKNVLQDLMQKEKDFIIEAGGKNLSNGEKQLINLIRVLMQENNILCLDEATSNLDNEASYIFYNNLNIYFKGYLINKLIVEELTEKTIILITHRVEQLKSFDKIYVMNNGEITDSGTYNDLVTRQSKLFLQLLEYKQ